MNKQEKEPAHHRSRVFEKSLGKHVACARLGGRAISKPTREPR